MRLLLLAIIPALAAAPAGSAAQVRETRVEALAAAYAYVNGLFVPGRRVFSFSRELSGVPAAERARFAGRIRADHGTFESVSACVGEGLQRTCHLVNVVAFMNFETFRLTTDGHSARTYVSLRCRSAQGEMSRALELELRRERDGPWSVTNVLNDIFF